MFSEGAGVNIHLPHIWSEQRWVDDATHWNGGFWQWFQPEPEFTGLWQNVGNGTVDNPQGEFVLTSGQLMSLSGGRAMADTWVWQRTPVITVYLDGELITFDDPPMIVEDRTMVPVRAIFEALGAEVGWHAEHQMIVMQQPEFWLEMTINNRTGNVMGEDVLMDVAPMIFRNRTFVPLRFIAESSGLGVDWVAETQTILITTELTVNIL